MLNESYLTKARALISRIVNAFHSLIFFHFSMKSSFSVAFIHSKFYHRRACTRDDFEQCMWDTRIHAAVSFYAKMSMSFLECTGHEPLKQKRGHVEILQ